MQQLVTDPSILKQLETTNGSNDSSGNRVTDPALISQLEGQGAESNWKPPSSDEEAIKPSNFIPADALTDVVVDSAKDIGKSFTLGHTREALNGQSHEPGFMSLRSISPPFILGRMLENKLGSDHTVTDTAAGMVNDVTDIASVGYPALQGALKGGVGLLRKLPGASPLLHEEAIGSARYQVPGLIKGENPDPLWAEFNATGKTNINPENLIRAIQETKQELLKSSNPDKQVLGFLQNMENRYVPEVQEEASPLLDMLGRSKPAPDSVRQPIKNIGIDQLEADRKSIGALTQSTDKAGKGTAHWVSDNLYGAVYDDYERAIQQAGASGEQAGKLIEAIKASKSEFARDNLSNIIERNITTRSGNIEYINVPGIKNSLKNTKIGQKIQGSISIPEIQSISEALDSIGTLPSPSAHGASNFGSGKYNIMVGTVFGVARLLGAAPHTAAEIAAIGAAAPHWISKALTTEQGRAFLRAASKRQYNLSMNEGLALAESIKAIQQEGPSNEAVGGLKELLGGKGGQVQHQR